MVDEVYQNAFKEINDILDNTDEELIKRIPIKFIEFIKNNMNKKYITNINTEIKISEQKLLKETESILSLIYRTYWANETEKKEFAEEDFKRILEIEKKKKENYIGKNVDEIFEKRKKVSENIQESNLIVVKKEGFIKRIFISILEFIKNKSNKKNSLK